MTTDNCDNFYLCTDLWQKQIIPIATRIRAESAKEFGDLVRHHGEECLYVRKATLGKKQGGIFSDLKYFSF